jgi:hypothetical protein
MLVLLKGSIEYWHANEAILYIHMLHPLLEPSGAKKKYKRCTQVKVHCELGGKARVLEVRSIKYAPYCNPY